MSMMAKATSYQEKLGWDGQWEKVFKPFSADGLIPARVISEYKATYLVSGEDHDYKARLMGKFRYESGGREGYPIVGDWVAIKPLPDIKEAIIQTVLPRRSKISRKVPLGESREQILAANVDKIFIVMALDQSFSLRSLERFLVVAKGFGLEAVVILNKMDLCDNVTQRLSEAKACVGEHPVLAVCSFTQNGYGNLRKHLQKGRTIVLIGPSGVGKSTIVNNFMGEEVQDVMDVRAADSKGRHMTSSRELFLLPQGALILDSPGLRELQLWETGQGVEEVFGEIDVLKSQCRFQDCTHQHEPGCAVHLALTRGELSQERYDSFIKLQKELAFLAARKEEKSWRERKNKNRKNLK